MLAQWQSLQPCNTSVTILPSKSAFGLCDAKKKFIKMLFAVTGPALTRACERTRTRKVRGNDPNAGGTIYWIDSTKGKYIYA